MMQLLMACHFVRDEVADVAAKLMQGDVPGALRDAAATMDDVRAPLVRRIAAGRLQAQVLLAAGREEEAEEQGQCLLRLYEGLPREQARQLAALDRGALELSRRHVAVAAQQFNDVADDECAVPTLRIQALAGLAVALVDLGEQRRAQMSIEFATTIACDEGDTSARQLLGALQLELEAASRLRSFEGSAESAPVLAHAVPDCTPLCQALRSAAAGLRSFALAEQRLQVLACLLSCANRQSRMDESARTAMRSLLSALRAAQLHRLEEQVRIEAGLACAAAGETLLLQEWLGALTADETRVERHRAAQELMLCLSHLHGHQGRHADALRLFRQYAQHSVHRLRRELPQLPYSRFLERRSDAAQADATELQLPARYRRAYRFIVENLGDQDLSVNQVAAHIDVTVRALQMTFRLHLGMTPAELIRRKRMTAIRTELLDKPGRESILEVATRWGMTSRSTLTQNYRQQFGEAPSQTLRLGAAAR